MKLRKKFIIKESDLELDKLLKSTKDLRVRMRIMFLILRYSPRFKNHKELAEYLGISSRSLFRWEDVYNESGLYQMLKISNGGKRREVVTQEIHAGLKIKLNDSLNPFLSYNRAIKWVKSEYNIDIKYNTLRTYMKRHFGTKLKTPRKSHYKKDEEAIEVFKKLTADPKVNYI